MRLLAAVFAGVALLVLPVFAWGAPSLLGPTGLLLTPTADTLGATEFNVGASAIRGDDRPDETIICANIGLLPGLEVGASREKLEGSEGETLVNAKLNLFRPPLGKLAVSAGMMDVTDQIDRTTYVVVSHTLGAGVVGRVGPVALPQVSIGIGNGRLDRVFGGVSTVIDGRVEMMAEYDGSHVNIGVRVPLALKFSATVAGLEGLQNLAAGVSFAGPW